MITDASSLFDAALALPQPVRADLAARLLESLEEELPPPDDRTPDEWPDVIKARSDAVHSGQAELIEGQVIADKLQAIIDRAGAADLRIGRDLNRGADEDIDRALAYFAQVSASVQAAFAKSLQTTLAQIARSPKRCARLETNDTDREIRRAILWRYNYLVVYEVIQETPVILAVTHASRDPEYWKSRERQD